MGKRSHFCEHYTKRFNCWIHLVMMLYPVIKRYDSLREKMTSLMAEALAVRSGACATCRRYHLKRWLMESDVSSSSSVALSATRCW